MSGSAVVILGRTGWAAGAGGAAGRVGAAGGAGGAAAGAAADWRVNDCFGAGAACWARAAGAADGALPWTQRTCQSPPRTSVSAPHDLAGVVLVGQPAGQRLGLVRQRDGAALDGRHRGLREHRLEAAAAGELAQ